MTDIYMGGYLSGGCEFYSLPEKCYLSLEEAQRALDPEGPWVHDERHPTQWSVESGPWPRATVIKLTLVGKDATPVPERKPVTLKLAMDPRTGSFTMLNQSSEELALFVEGTDHDPKVPYQMMPTTTFLYRREVKEKP